MNHRLYEYPEVIDEILSRVQDGELTPELEEELDQALGGLHEKVRHTIGMIRCLEAMATSCGDEIVRLRVRQRTLVYSTESLKRYLIRCMQHEAIDRVVTDIGGVSIARNPRPTIRWAWTDRDPPPEFLREKVVREVDLEAAQDAYKAGCLPEGFEVEHGKHLRIR